MHFLLFSKLRVRPASRLSPTCEGNDPCQLSLKVPELAVGSTFTLEAELKCSESYNVKFKLNDELHSFTSVQRANSGQVEFKFSRTSHPVDLKDAGKKVQAIGVKHGSPTLRSRELHITVFDRPVVITSRLRNETANYGQKVVKKISVRQRSPGRLSKDAVRVMQRQPSTANDSKLGANVTVFATKEWDIHEAIIEFVAQKSGWIWVEIHSKFFIEQSPSFELEVTPGNAHLENCCIVVSVLFMILLAISVALGCIIWRYRSWNGPLRSTSEDENEAASEMLMQPTGKILTASTSRSSVAQGVADNAATASEGGSQFV